MVNTTHEPSRSSMVVPAAMVVVVLSSCSSPSMDTLVPIQLRGLSDVHVGVYVDREVVNFADLEQRIRSLVVEALRTEGLGSQGENARLFLTATLHELDSDVARNVVAASVRLDLREPVRLMRDPEVIVSAEGGALIWSKMSVIVDRPDRIRVAIEREARVLATMFTSDVRAANR